MRVGINGLGRVGRLALRAAMGGVTRGAADPRAGVRLDIVHVNELKAGVATAAHLVEFDSVHGRWRTAIEVSGQDGIARTALHDQRHQLVSQHRADLAAGQTSLSERPRPVYGHRYG